MILPFGNQCPDADDFVQRKFRKFVSEHFSRLPFVCLFGTMYASRRRKIRYGFEVQNDKVSRGHFVIAWEFKSVSSASHGPDGRETAHRGRAARLSISRRQTAPGRIRLICQSRTAFDFPPLLTTRE